MRQTLDSNRRSKMSLAARELALRHTFAANVQQIVGIYEELSQRR